jgi:hypothetical protein
MGSSYCDNNKWHCTGQCGGKWLAHPPSVCGAGHDAAPLPHVHPYDSRGATDPLDVKVLTYNLYWWKLFDIKGGNFNGQPGSAGKLIAGSSSPPYDVIGFQECKNPWRVLFDAGKDKEFWAVHANHDICVAYRKSAWSMIAHGFKDVSADTGGKGANYGTRGVIWIRLRHKESERTLFFLNHHGPLPLNSGGNIGGAATAHNILQVIRDKTQKGDAVIAVGDFNANPSSLTVQQIMCRMHKIYSGTKFGGIDNMFTNVAKSYVSSANLGGGGSDHDALQLVVRLPPMTTKKEHNVKVPV